MASLVKANEILRVHFIAREIRHKADRQIYGKIKDLIQAVKGCDLDSGQEKRLKDAIYKLVFGYFAQSIEKCITDYEVELFLNEIAENSEWSDAARSKYLNFPRFEQDVLDTVADMIQKRNRTMQMKLKKMEIDSFIANLPAILTKKEDKRIGAW